MEDQSDSIISPQQFDVLLGRGNGVNHRPGNVSFRALADRRCEEFMSGTAKQRNVLAQELIDHVEKQGGRFLKQVTLKVDGEYQNAWQIVPQSVAILKTKQALRDRALNGRKLKQRKESQMTMATSGRSSSKARGSISDHQRQLDQASRYLAVGPPQPRVILPALQPRMLSDLALLTGAHPTSRGRPQPPGILRENFSSLRQMRDSPSTGLLQPPVYQNNSPPPGIESLVSSATILQMHEHIQRLRSGEEVLLASLRSRLQQQHGIRGQAAAPQDSNWSSTEPRQT